MRQRAISILVAFLLVMLFTFAALACFISTDPEIVRADANGRASFDAVIRWEHRRCVLADHDVNIDVTGLKILKQTGWEKASHGHFKNHIDVQLTEKTGALRIWRECRKKGVSEHTVRIARAATGSAR